VGLLYLKPVTRPQDGEQIIGLAPRKPSYLPKDFAKTYRNARGIQVRAKDLNDLKTLRS
jgi:hypothetical protein